eukprot:scaffold4269_cov121-Skeletonema_dohrnii-CCMP3373.AAC.1
MRLTIRPIDRAAQGLSKTPLIALIRPLALELEGKIRQKQDIVQMKCTGTEFEVEAFRNFERIIFEFEPVTTLRPRTRILFLQSYFLCSLLQLQASTYFGMFGVW